MVGKQKTVSQQRRSLRCDDPSPPPSSSSKSSSSKSTSTSSSTSTTTTPPPPPPPPPTKVGIDNVLLLGMSYPSVEGQMIEHGFDKSLLHYQEPCVEQAVECVRRGILTEMDGRDYARCVATEIACHTDVYTVSMEIGGIYRQDRHMHGNFNVRNFVPQITQKFGSSIKFQQVVLDYYWMPTGWLVTRWAKSLFQQTLPDLVRYGLLQFPSKRKKKIINQKPTIARTTTKQQQRQQQQRRRGSATTSTSTSTSGEERMVGDTTNENNGDIENNKNMNMNDTEHEKEQQQGRPTSTSTSPAATTTTTVVSMIPTAATIEPLDVGAVYLPFCAHCCKEVVGAIHILKEYYAIDFITKHQLAGHCLWRGTMLIDGNTMQTRLGKRLDQEELYCTFKPRDIYESMEDSHISKPAVMKVLLRIPNYDDVRMIRLRPLKQHEPPSIMRERLIQPEIGGFINLMDKIPKTMTATGRIKPISMTNNNKASSSPTTTSTVSPKKITSTSSKKKKRPFKNLLILPSYDDDDEEDFGYDEDEDENENDSDNSDCNKEEEPPLKKRRGRGRPRIKNRERPPLYDDVEEVLDDGNPSFIPVYLLKRLHEEQVAKEKEAAAVAVAAATATVGVQHDDEEEKDETPPAAAAMAAVAVVQEQQQEEEKEEKQYGRKPAPVVRVPQPQKEEEEKEEQEQVSSLLLSSSSLSSSAAVAKAPQEQQQQQQDQEEKQAAAPSLLSSSLSSSLSSIWQQQHQQHQQQEKRHQLLLHRHRRVQFFGGQNLSDMDIPETTFFFPRPATDLLTYRQPVKQAKFDEPLLVMTPRSNVFEKERLHFKQQQQQEQQDYSKSRARAASSSNWSAKAFAKGRNYEEEEDEDEEEDTKDEQDSKMPPTTTTMSPQLQQRLSKPQASNSDWLEDNSYMDEEDDRKMMSSTRTSQYLLSNPRVVAMKPPLPSSPLPTPKDTSTSGMAIAMAVEKFLRDKEEKNKTTTDMGIKQLLHNKKEPQQDDVTLSSTSNNEKYYSQNLATTTTTTTATTTSAKKMNYGGGGILAGTPMDGLELLIPQDAGRNDLVDGACALFEMTTTTTSSSSPSQNKRKLRKSPASLTPPSRTKRGKKKEKEVDESIIPLKLARMGQPEVACYKIPKSAILKRLYDPSALKQLSKELERAEMEAKKLVPKDWKTSVLSLSDLMLLEKTKEELKQHDETSLIEVASGESQKRRARDVLLEDIAKWLISDRADSFDRGDFKAVDSLISFNFNSIALHAKRLEQELHRYWKLKERGAFAKRKRAPPRSNKNYSKALLQKEASEQEWAQREISGLDDLAKIAMPLLQQELQLQEEQEEEEGEARSEDGWVPVLDTLALDGLAELASGREKLDMEWFIENECLEYEVMLKKYAKRYGSDRAKVLDEACLWVADPKADHDPLREFHLISYLIPDTGDKSLLERAHELERAIHTQRAYLGQNWAQKMSTVDMMDARKSRENSPVVVIDEDETMTSNHFTCTVEISPDSSLASTPAEDDDVVCCCVSPTPPSSVDECLTDGSVPGIHRQDRWGAVTDLTSRFSTPTHQGIASPHENSRTVNDDETNNSNESGFRWVTVQKLNCQRGHRRDLPTRTLDTIAEGEY